MLVSEGMSDVVLTVGPGHSLREAAAMMWQRRVGAELITEPLAERRVSGQRLGLLTGRRGG